MKAFALAIFKDADNPTYGVVVPDVPGCYPCGDSIEAAIEDSKSAIKAHIEFMLENDLEIDLATRPIEELRTDPDYADAVAWGIAEIDESALSAKQTRFNVSWPEYLLVRVDQYAADNHDTRSGFLAKAALAAIEKKVKATV